MSRRSGPSGEFQRRLTPADARTEASSARQKALVSPASQLAMSVLRQVTGTKQRAGIHEHGAAHAEILGDEREREADLRRRRPEGLAAQRVAGYQVARTEATTVEAADSLAALVEQVDQAHVVATPAPDVAADGAADEGDLRR